MRPVNVLDETPNTRLQCGKLCGEGCIRLIPVRVISLIVVKIPTKTRVLLGCG